MTLTFYIRRRPHRLSEGYLQFYSICTWIPTQCIFYGVFHVGGVLMYSLFIV
jgi:hypothetical protein